jgi:hypothetical protein
MTIFCILYSKLVCIELLDIKRFNLSESELLYGWLFTANQFVLAPSPVKNTTIFFSTETLRSESLCNILSDERMGLSFSIAAGPRFTRVYFARMRYSSLFHRHTLSASATVQWMHSFRRFTSPLATASKVYRRSRSTFIPQR